MCLHPTAQALFGFASHHTGTQRKVCATSEERASPLFAVESGPPRTRFSEIRVFEELDSTNRYLVDEARAGALEGLVAVAAYQSEGRGRMGRRWEAPSGANLLASVLLRQQLPLEELHLLTVVAALAAGDACAEVAELHPDLEWPNDLYVGAKKLAGILAESVPGDKRSGEGRAVVVGIGLNLRWPPPDSEADRATVPEELRGIATSLWTEIPPGADTSRLDPRIVLELWLGALEHRVEDLSHGDGRRRQAAEYRRRCTTLGKRVRVTLGESVLEGVAVDVTPEGHLVVDEDGRFRTVTAGDVVHVD